VWPRLGRCISLLFHDRGTRRGWVVKSMLRPHFTSGKTRYPFYRRLGGPQGRSGRAENLVPTGIRSRTVQPVVSRYTDWATRPIYYIYVYILYYMYENNGYCNTKCSWSSAWHIIEWHTLLSLLCVVMYFVSELCLDQYNERNSNSLRHKTHFSCACILVLCDHYLKCTS